MTDSSTGGYLTPTSAIAEVEEDAALDATLQQFCVGVTGLAGSVVRPRWQLVPPNAPEASVNWMSVGVVNVTADELPAISHHSLTFDMPPDDISPGVWDTPGETWDPTPINRDADILLRQEELEVLCSFYGPNAGKYAARVRDGVYIPQNREALFLKGLTLIRVGTLLAAPELFNNQWYRRVDLSIFLRRRIARSYAVLNVESAQGVVSAQDADYTDPIEVTNT